MFWLNPRFPFLRHPLHFNSAPQPCGNNSRISSACWLYTTHHFVTICIHQTWFLCMVVGISYWLSYFCIYLWLRNTLSLNFLSFLLSHFYDHQTITLMRTASQLTCRYMDTSSSNGRANSRRYYLPITTSSTAPISLVNRPNGPLDNDATSFWKLLVMRIR